MNIYNNSICTGPTPTRTAFIGGIMDNKLNEVYSCLKVMDMMLYISKKNQKTMRYCQMSQMSNNYDGLAERVCRCSNGVCSMSNNRAPCPQLLLRLSWVFILQK